MTTEKFCTKCGKKFIATGREVICPECKQAAAEESKRAAVMRAKTASWMGESVPVRISGRASTVIRRYGAANNLPFAAALDALLKASTFFQSTGKAWEEVEPYRSRRRDKAAADKAAADKAAADKAAAVFLHDKHATENEQGAPQEATGKPQDVQDAPQEVKQAAQAAKTVKTVKATKKAAGASKTAAKKGGKA